jgi:uncharacterized membrane protein
MAFCPNCGSKADGNFCPNCGSSIGGATDTGAPSPGPAASSGLADNIAGALAYIPIVGIIFLLIEPYNRNRNTRFHAFQGLFLLAAYIVVRVLLSVLATMFWSFWMLYALVGLAFAVVWIYCMYKAFTNEKVVLPIIGPLAEKQA